MDVQVVLGQQEVRESFLFHGDLCKLSYSGWDAQVHPEMRRAPRLVHKAELFKDSILASCIEFQDGWALS